MNHLKTLELQAAYEAVQEYTRSLKPGIHTFRFQQKSPVTMRFRNIASHICPMRPGAPIVLHIEDVQIDMNEVMVPKKGQSLSSASTFAQPRA